MASLTCGLFDSTLGTHVAWQLMGWRLWRSCWCQEVVLKDVTILHTVRGWQALGPQASADWQETRCGLPAPAPTHHPSLGFMHKDRRYFSMVSRLVRRHARTKGFERQHAARK